MKKGDRIPGLIGWEYHGDPPKDIPGLEVVGEGTALVGGRSPSTGPRRSTPARRGISSSTHPPSSGRRASARPRPHPALDPLDTPARAGRRVQTITTTFCVGRFTARSEGVACRIPRNTRPRHAGQRYGIRRSGRKGKVTDVPENSRRPRTRIRMTRQLPRRLPVVDAHVHCSPAATTRASPTMPTPPIAPSLRRTPEHLLAHGRGGRRFRRDRPSRAYRDDHRYLDHVLGVGGDRFRPPARSPTAPTPDRLGAGRTTPRHDRRRASTPTRERSPFGSPALRSFWSCAADLGLAVQIHFEPRYAPGFEPLIREFRTRP